MIINVKYGQSRISYLHIKSLIFGDEIFWELRFGELIFCTGSFVRNVGWIVKAWDLFDQKGPAKPHTIKNPPKNTMFGRVKWKLCRKLLLLFHQNAKRFAIYHMLYHTLLLKNFEQKNELIKDFNLLETNIRVKEKNYVYEIKRFPQHRPTAYQHIYYVVLFWNTFFFLLIFMFSSPRRVICIFYHILRYDVFFWWTQGWWTFWWFLGWNEFFNCWQIIEILAQNPAKISKLDKKST